jgi:hypothetical protein
MWRGRRDEEASQTRGVLRRTERDASRGSLRSFTRAKNALFQDDKTLQRNYRV